MQSFQLLFDRRYPESVRWNLNCKESLFQPGITADILNRFESSRNRFRRLTDQSGNVKAWAAYQKQSGFADMLWDITAESLTDDEYRKVLTELAAAFQREKPIKIDVPCGKKTSVYTDAGFIHMQTLAWMWKKL